MIGGWDTETHLIQPGMVTPRMVCLSGHSGDPIDGGVLFARDDADQIVRQYHGSFAPKWEWWLLSHLRKGDTLVAHNLAYDFCVVVAERPRLLRELADAVDRRQLRCTYMRQCLLDIAAGESDFRRVWDGAELKMTKSGRSLADLGRLYFGEAWAKGEDTWRLRYSELDGVPLPEWPKEAVEYPLEDAVRPVRVFHAQGSRAAQLRDMREMEGVWESEPGEIPDELPQTRKAIWLQLMSAWGLRTDPVAVAELKAEHEADQLEIRRRLEPTGMIRPDGSRDMKVIRARVELAYARLMVRLPQTTGGATSTSGETLVDSGDEELALLGESLSDAATIGTWLPHLEQGTTAPICVGYNPLVDTGRTSARKPNIQNPPRKGKIRSCFVPRAARYEEVEVPNDYVLQPGEEYV